MLKTKICPFYASWPDAMINTHKLKLTLSRTYFYDSKGVRAIEVQLYESCLAETIKGAHDCVKSTLKASLRG